MASRESVIALTQCYGVKRWKLYRTYAYFTELWHFCQRASDSDGGVLKCESAYAYLRTITRLWHLVPDDRTIHPGIDFPKECNFSCTKQTSVDPVQEMGTEHLSWKGKTVRTGAGLPTTQLCCSFTRRHQHVILIRHAEAIRYNALTLALFIIPVIFTTP